MNKKAYRKMIRATRQQREQAIKSKQRRKPRVCEDAEVMTQEYQRDHDALINSKRAARVSKKLTGPVNRDK